MLLNISWISHTILSMMGNMPYIIFDGSKPNTMPGQNIFGGSSNPQNCNSKLFRTNLNLIGSNLFATISNGAQRPLLGLLNGQMDQPGNDNSNVAQMNPQQQQSNMPGSMNGLNRI